jgi:hypothetical protein
LINHRSRCELIRQWAGVPKNAYGGWVAVTWMQYASDTTITAEPAQAHRARRRDLQQRQLGDQEAGEDEEQVDADEPTGDVRHAEVVGHDEQHRERTETLDVIPFGQSRLPLDRHGVIDPASLVRRQSHGIHPSENATVIGRDARRRGKVAAILRS